MRLIPGTEIHAACLLFDMDGTLVDSTRAVERVWQRWAEARGISFESFRHTMHGRRAIDTLRDVIPSHLDLASELEIIDGDELKETEGIVATPGAAELLATLPPDAWALVTSAQHPLAQVRMHAAGLPWPGIVVSAEDIHAGKPDPECYLLALRRLGQSPDSAVVFEDAPAGLAAGHAAGCRTIAVAACATEQALAGEDWLPDLSRLTLAGIDADGKLRLRVR